MIDDELADFLFAFSRFFGMCCTFISALISLVPSKTDIRSRLTVICDT